MLGIIVLVAVGFVALAWLVRVFEPRLAFFPFPGENRTPAEFGVPFTALTIHTADGEQLRGWHLARPDAVAQVVYFHGNGGNLSVWSDVLVGIVRRGYEVIAVDYRGFGLSTGSPTEPGLYRDVDATLATVDQKLRRADLPLIYWGRSIGTAMAAYGASRRAPDGVILEAGFPNARSIFSGNPVMTGLMMFGTYRFPTAEWMAQFDRPTLVLHGDADSIIPYRAGQQLFESLPGPKTLVTIAGGDHNDPEPRDAAHYWGAVKDFITSIPARR
jgi:fermentation-respiration switch protein FrsA (DUF1100 family)